MAFDFMGARSDGYTASGVPFDNVSAILVWSFEFEDKLGPSHDIQGPVHGIERDIEDRYWLFLIVIHCAILALLLYGPLECLKNIEIHL